MLQTLVVLSILGQREWVPIISLPTEESVRGREDVLSASHLAEALSPNPNAMSAGLLWLEGSFLASPLSLFWLKCLLSSSPISYSCLFLLPNHSSFNCGPLAFSRKWFVPCKRNIDFYITWPMRLWKFLPVSVAYLWLGKGELWVPWDFPFG